MKVTDLKKGDNVGFMNNGKLTFAKINEINESTFHVTKYNLGFIGCDEKFTVNKSDVIGYLHQGKVNNID